MHAWPIMPSPCWVYDLPFHLAAYKLSLIYWKLLIAVFAPTTECSCMKDECAIHKSAHELLHVMFLPLPAWQAQQPGACRSVLSRLPRRLLLALSALPARPVRSCMKDEARFISPLMSSSKFCFASACMARTAAWCVSKCSSKAAFAGLKEHFETHTRLLCLPCRQRQNKKEDFVSEVKNRASSFSMLDHRERKHC